MLLAKLPQHARLTSAIAYAAPSLFINTQPLVPLASQCLASNRRLFSTLKKKNPKGNSGSSSRWLRRAQNDPYAMGAQKPGLTSGRTKKGRPVTSQQKSHKNTDFYAVLGGGSTLPPAPPAYRPTVSRASHKLNSLLHSHLLATPKPCVILDIGAAPGGWSDAMGFYLENDELWGRGGGGRKPLSRSPVIVACDLLPHSVPPHLNSYDFVKLTTEDVHLLPEVVSNVTEPTYVQLIHDFTTLHDGLLPRCDMLLSDIAPNTTGTVVDEVRQNTMVLSVLALAQRSVVKGGCAVFKYFNAGDEEVMARMKEKGRELFEVVKVVKPRGSRTESREMFLVCLERKA